MRPYYEGGGIRIYHGDCEDVLPTLAPVDMVFTSPPYNLGAGTGGGFGHYNLGSRGGASKWHGNSLEAGYDGHDDAMPLPEYETWQKRVLTLCWAQLTDTGAIFYNHKPRVQARELWLPLRCNPDLPIRQIVTWARAGGLNFAPTHYVPTYEWIIIFAKHDWRLRDKSASGLGDVWRVAQETNLSHPAPFPVALPAHALETVAPDCVVDPFMGSGSTLRAAKDRGIPAVGIETSEAYCEVAALRCSQEVFAFDSGYTSTRPGRAE